MSLLKIGTSILSLLPDRLIRFIGKKLSDYLVKKYASLDIHGLDVIKGRIGKPTIFIANHLSNADGVILNKLLKENTIAFLAGVKLDKSSLTSFFLKTVNYIPIHPNKADRNAIKTALKWLKDGNSIVIFPEGTRSRTGAMIQAKKGFVLLAKLANVPIVPIALEGTEKLLPISDNNMSNEVLQKATIKITIGKEFSLPSKEKYNEPGTWEDTSTDLAMQKIAEMLAPQYRGI